jgi:hypothetical protein
MISVYVFMVLDCLTGLRFYLLRNHEMAFLESVMTAHPELDPDLIEGELFQKLQQLLDALSGVKPITSYFKVLTGDQGINRVSIF